MKEFINDLIQIKDSIYKNENVNESLNKLEIIVAKQFKGSFISSELNQTVFLLIKESSLNDIERTKAMFDDLLILIYNELGNAGEV